MALAPMPAGGQVLPFASLANYEFIGERGKRQDLTPAQEARHVL